MWAIHKTCDGTYNSTLRKKAGYDFQNTALKSALKEIFDGWFWKKE